MSRQGIDIDQLLSDANPVPVKGASVAGEVLDARARTDLEAIVQGRTDRPRVSVSSGGATASRRTHHRRTVLVGAVAAAAAVAFSTGTIDIPGVSTGSSNSAYAATPKPLVYASVDGNSATALNSIADRVDALSGEMNHGKYAKVSTQSWSLFTRVDGQRITSKVVPEQKTVWLAGDGSGRTVTHYIDSPEVAGQDKTYASGGLSSLWPQGSLSSDEATLESQLQVGHPVGEPAERLTAVTDAYKEQVLTPRVRAAMLRYLAATPGLTLTGSTKDRLGREGTAFSLDSNASGLPTRYTLIIDFRTGSLLGEEETLTTTAGSLRVRVPSVISYVAYRSNAYTDHLA